MRRHSKLPFDWPEPDSLDLDIHDLPHRSSSTEWWYVNSHLPTKEGRCFSVFASFFRMRLDKSEWVEGREYCHSLVWGLIDLDNQDYYPVSYFENTAPQIIKKRLLKGEGPRDPRMKRALTEVVEQGHLPRPDRLCKDAPKVGTEKLFIDFGGDRFFKLDDGSYCLEIWDDERNLGSTLIFQPQKKFIRHGDNGVVSGAHGEEMFYYFNPRCQVRGWIQLGKERFECIDGLGWYDREFGRSTAGDEQQVGWCWLSTQLNDGTELSVYDLFDREKANVSCGHWAVYIEKDGMAKRYEDFTLTKTKSWRSCSTFTDFPIAWSLSIPTLELKLEAHALFAQQEVITANSEPSFWEGRVKVVGSIRGNPIEGPGFVECAGFNFLRDLDDFYASVGDSTRKAIARLLPKKPNQEAVKLLSGTSNWPHITKGIESIQISQLISRPLRTIIDRGGKAWRSYSLLISCEIVGGNPNDYEHYLALPEILHSGSLIVDDVQDRSTVRRGGPSCHLMYGEPLAINVGCAAYFLSELVLAGDQERIPQEAQLSLYRLYFELLRAAHVGQALDLAGVGDFVLPAIESGDISTLEQRILTIHRLKSAVPARVSAEGGAILGGGNSTQIKAIGDYVESLGLAFQIVDDVLNLRGFKTELKEKGEDLREGKLTMPVVKAFARLQASEARSLWEKIQRKPKEPALVSQLIDEIEACGALDACMKMAEELVESAWQEFSPHFPDSFTKMRFRAFGFYLLERHY
ncbi:MAG: polyprenyl synthetase family protein [Xenococcaceae cyanobacterium]